MNPKKKLMLINLGLDPDDFDGWYSEDFYSQIAAKLQCSRDEAKKLCYKAAYSHEQFISDVNAAKIKKGMKNNIFRNCFKRSKENCVFVAYNEHGTSCCTIDKIVQIEFYGCTPQAIIDRKSKQFEEEDLI